VKAVLADTSVWVDHFRRHHAALAGSFGVQYRPVLH
jgi:hypothetical protein